MNPLTHKGRTILPGARLPADLSATIIKQVAGLYPGLSITEALTRYAFDVGLPDDLRPTTAKKVAIELAKKQPAIQ